VVEKCAQLGVGRVVSVIGRYFAMDRDNRWNRIEKAYEALVHGNGIKRPNAVEALKEWYSEETTDEFIPPTLIHGDSPAEVTTLQDGDGVIFFNFRADRARELIKALVNEDFAEFERARPPRVNITCMSQYDATFTLPVAFEPVKLTNILAHVLAEHGMPQYRISETEKYPHVTYFFNGGDETPVEGEDRFLIPSPRVATYDKLPEMSAHGITLNLMAQILAKSHAFYAVNFANTDMVGHSGILPAAIEATEAVDRSVGLVLRAIERVGGVALITSDHGNVECMIGDDGQPHTAHTTNPVDITYVGPESNRVELRDGVLADVAPTILKLLNLPKPKEMTGETLFK
jgi:2,3-bisphosphoglycerate-independent phosphoglycerate mutase